MVFQNKDKLEKLRGQAETFCHRLGRYRMPFAWATLKIMDVISTAAIDRDVADSESLKGGMCLCVFVLMGNTLWWLACICVHFHGLCMALCVSFDPWPLHSVFLGKSSSIDRRTQLPRRNSERYNTIDDQFCSISAFKPATITISTIFKQVWPPLPSTKRQTFLSVTSLRYTIKYDRQINL